MSHLVSFWFTFSRNICKYVILSHLVSFWFTFFRNICKYITFESLGLILIYFLQKSAHDISNFDTDFTMEKPVITPPDKDYIKTINQKVFKGFSYTSAMADVWLYNETTSYKCSLTFNQSNAICDKIIVVLNIGRSIALLSTQNHKLIFILMHLMLYVNWRATVLFHNLLAKMVEF